MPKEGPFILVSNHRSIWDPLVIMAAVRRPVLWFAASFLLKVPILGRLSNVMGTKYIDLGMRSDLNAIHSMEESVGAKSVVGLFPEGADRLRHCVTSLSLMPFLRGFSYFSVKKGIPVLPVCVVPLKEGMKGYPVSHSIRKIIFGKKDYVCVERRIVYKQALVHFLPLMNPPKGNQSRRAIDEFAEEVRSRMQSALDEYAGSGIVPGG